MADPEALEVTVNQLLRRLGLRLATAESCTGGLIGHLLTNVPGSSDGYLGGVVAYSNDVKMRLLGVSAETLARHGAVSRETVLEMAQGVRQALHADIGLAVSGIAGPGGGSAQKPVGLVWIGLNAEGFSQAWSQVWPGGRLEVKEQAARRALELLAGRLAAVNSE